MTAGLLLASCGKKGVEDQREAKGGKKYGGTFRMNEVQQIRTLDPVRLNDAPSHHVVHQICDLLVDFDSTLTLQPELAESWEVSPDGLTYTYHLRHGVMFHDSPVFPGGKGREMKASDVKYCFDRIIDARSGTLGATYFLDKVKGAEEYYRATEGGSAPSASSTGSSAAPGAGSSAASTSPAVKGAKPSGAAKQTGTVTARPDTHATASAPTAANGIPAGGVSGFRVIDDYTFAIDLIKPFAVFKYYPALGFGYIYPKEAVEHYGRDFFRNLVGTGPFILDHWDQDQELVLKRNPKYWRTDEAGNQLPLLDKVTFTFIKDEKQQINEFKLGRLEESYRIPTEFFRAVIGENGKVTPEYAKYQLHAIPALSTQFYGMLTTSDAFKDPRVRRAFNYAIDRDKIIRYVLQGQATGPATHGLVPPSIKGYDVTKIKGYSYDLDKARALLAEAGYPGGKGFPAVSLQLNSGGGRNELIAEAVQEMLTKGLGVQVNLKLLEWAQHLDLVDNGKAPFYRLGWIADYPEPESFLNLFYSKNIPPTGPSSINSTRYRNARYDSLFEKALGTIDDAQRYALYQQAEQIAVDESPVLLIYNDLDYRLVQPYVRGYASNSMDRRDLTWTWFDYGKK